MINKKVLFVFIALICTNLVQAQFIINDNFKSKKTSSVIKLGGDAFLTAGVIDSDGDGWLRLSNATRNSRGYAFIDEAFSSTLGIIAEFEFKAWRDTELNGYTGGDGFSVFLFDGNVKKEDFRLGAYGGSLGYTKNTAVSPQVNNGLKGGYIGVGFDSYGGFGNNSEGKNGLLNDNKSSIEADSNGDSTRPNAIVLRGATDENVADNSNRILDFKKLGDRSGNANAIRKRSELDYDVLTKTRPTDNLFYRKTKIIIKPIGDTKSYRIQIFMAKAINVAYDVNPIIDYVTQQAIPSTLKIGFAASTGGAYNNHEIRNLQITTTGNLSVFNSVDTPLICNELQSKEVSFNINVNNANSVAIKKIDFESSFLNNKTGKLLNESEFKINSITPSSNISNNTINNTSNKLKGSLELPAESTGTIIIKATINKPNIEVTNVVDVSSTELVDQDLSNNTSYETIKRYQCKVPTNPMIFIKSK